MRLFLTSRILVLKTLMILLMFTTYYLTAQGESKIYRVAFLNHTYEFQGKKVDTLTNYKWFFGKNDNDSNGRRTYKTEYVFDEDGRRQCTTTEVSIIDSTLFQGETIYRRNNVTHLVDTMITIGNWLADTSLSTYSKIVYDYDSLLIEARMFNEYGGVWYKNRFQLNEAGYPLKCVRVNHDKTERIEEIASYDYHAEIITILKDPEENYSTSYVAEILPGALLRSPKREVLFNRYGDIVYEREKIVVVHRYEYDEYNNWTRKETFHLDFLEKEMTLRGITVRDIAYSH